MLQRHLYPSYKIRFYEYQRCFASGRKLTSSSEIHLSADDRFPDSVTILRPFCFSVFICLLVLKWETDLKRCCIFLGIREAGYTSTKPGLFITFSLNLAQPKKSIHYQQKAVSIDTLSINSEASSQFTKTRHCTAKGKQQDPQRDVVKLSIKVSSKTNRVPLHSLEGYLADNGINQLHA